MKVLHRSCLEVQVCTHHHSFEFVNAVHHLALYLFLGQRQCRDRGNSNRDRCGYRGNRNTSHWGLNCFISLRTHWIVCHRNDVTRSSFMSHMEFWSPSRDHRLKGIFPKCVENLPDVWTILFCFLKGRDPKLGHASTTVQHSFLHFFLRNVASDRVNPKTKDRNNWSYIDCDVGRALVLPNRSCQLGTIWDGGTSRPTSTSHISSGPNIDEEIVHRGGNKGWMESSIAGRYSYFINHSFLSGIHALEDSVRESWG